MNIEITTDQLTIKPIGIQDADFMMELANSEGWLEFIGDRGIHTREDAINYIQKILDNPEYFYHIFSLKSDLTPLGVVTFLKRENESHPDFGFAILPSYEKQGLVREASLGYLAELKKHKKGDKVIAITKPNNDSSIGLLKRIGLLYDGDKVKNEETLSYFSMIL